MPDKFSHPCRQTTLWLQRYNTGIWSNPPYTNLTPTIHQPYINLTQV
ncbi:MAG: hypothetical protein IKR83_04575 [Bacteroidales bacterium]|nr:hypothetical protein [Bacteroidales bacterium]